MLKFVRHVRAHVTPTQGPMVVHCSAGVGRTGTFIAIDILLQRIVEVGGVVNVQEVVCRMRAQRGSMVQTTVRIEFVIIVTLYLTHFLLTLYPICIAGSVFVHLRLSAACSHSWRHRGQCSYVE